MLRDYLHFYTQNRSEAFPRLAPNTKSPTRYCDVHYIIAISSKTERESRISFLVPAKRQPSWPVRSHTGAQLSIWWLRGLERGTCCTLCNCEWLSLAMMKHERKATECCRTFIKPAVSAFVRSWVKFLWISKVRRNYHSWDLIEIRYRIYMRL